MALNGQPNGQANDALRPRNGVSKPPKRRIRVSRPVPAPGPDDPSDDDLLRFLDGAMTPEERAAFELRLRRSPYAAARIDVLRDALAENGWPVDD